MSRLCVAAAIAAALPLWQPTASSQAHAPAKTAAITQVGIENLAAAAQTNTPVTFGQVFAVGAVPAGKSAAAAINGADIPIQVDAKATHPDGSLRHAVLTVIAPNLPANGSTPLDLRTVDATATGAPISSAAVLATSFDAVVTTTIAGTAYRASAREALQTNAGVTWLGGPLVTEWLLRAPLKTAGGQAHPHLVARFAVRAYQGLARVRVDVIVENVWAYAANPSNVSYDLNVSVGAANVLSRAALTHYHHARWRKTFWWGAEPRAHLKHNGRYIINARAVANYDPAVAISQSALNALASGWKGPDTDLMGVGNVEAYMPTTGGRPEIGALPAFAVAYLLSADTRAMSATLGTGDLAGTWQIHYRDQDTDLPVSLDAHPYMTLLGNPGDAVNPATGKSDAFPDCAACATPNTPDSSHQPSLAYLPYVLTGDHYYLEELQFWANYNMLQHNPYYRGFEKGLFHPDQVRGQAWSLRELGYAAYITPDAHPLKAYFNAKLANNIVWYTNEYPNRAGANPHGILESGYAFAYENGRGVAPWQDDFFTWSVGHLVDMGFVAAAPLLRWKSRFAIGRMTAPGFCWIFGASYFLLVRDAQGAPVYPALSQAYQATADANAKDLPCASAAMGAALGLQAGEMTGYSSSTEGYPSNMQPALAVAAQSGIANAAQAWSLFAARAVKPDYSDSAQFAIVPRADIGPLPTPSPTAILTQHVRLPLLIR